MKSSVSRVVETPAAYSSRFCSRSGVPGFRAAEVTLGFTKGGEWAWLAGKTDDQGNPTEEAQQLLDLDGQLAEAQSGLESDWKESARPGPCPKRTLLAPVPGGPVFVPAVDTVEGSDLGPAVVQADINAAVNLALRATADPRLWTIHPRLRSQREGGDKPAKAKKATGRQEAVNASSEARLFTREKRKFGESGKPLVIHSAQGAKPDSTRQPNFFADLAGLEAVAQRLAERNPREHGWLRREWRWASISGESAAPPLVHGKLFWGCVRAAQWERVGAINAAASPVGGPK